MSAACRLCRHASQAVARHRLLGRHDVDYLLCPHCGLLQTEQPHWLQEAYSQPIAERDTGIVERNLRLARIATALIGRLHGREVRCLDAAGGYGLYTRLMRDAGFDCFWSDAHTPNLLARGFEAPADAMQFPVVSAFEVLEHLSEPLEFLQDLQRKTGFETLIASTQLWSGAVPGADWWYYVFDTGQHISFYQRRTLEYLASALGCSLHSARDVHLFTSRRLSPAAFRWLTGKRSAPLAAAWTRLRMRSRVWSDSELLARRA